MKDRSRFGFTLVEIMIVVLIIGILLAIAIPNFISARESSRAKSCISGLATINSAKTQCIMDNNLSPTSAATFFVDGTTVTVAGSKYQLAGGQAGSNYIRSAVACPSGGHYNTGNVNTSPTCDITGAVGSGYAVGEKWYHGF